MKKPIGLSGFHFKLSPPEIPGNSADGLKYTQGMCGPMGIPLAMQKHRKEFCIKNHKENVST